MSTDEQENDGHRAPPERTPAPGPAFPGDRLRNAKELDDIADEKELWEGGFSGKAMIGSWVAGITITVIILVVMLMVQQLRSQSIAWYVATGLVGVMWIYLVGLMFYRKWGMRYELTTQRLKHREGILFRKLDRIELLDIDDVIYRQGPVQAIMGVGNITISSSDKSHPELTLLGIANVREVADLIDDARRTERRKRGLHIESI